MSVYMHRQYHVNQPLVLSRFAHALRNKKDCITVFSGDVFGPSLESSVLKGEHVVPILNHLGIDVACYGNHDFDFGAEKLTELSSKCNFPWLLSNAFTSDGKLLASAKEYVVLESKGYKVGFFGLAGTDWPSNCQHLPRECVITDPVETARRVSTTLREKEGVDIVVAVTHMRLAEDILVSDACGAEVDLILGGHDHDIMIHGDRITMIDNDARGAIRIVKSGTDFRSYSIIRLLVSRVEGHAKVLETRVHHERDLGLVNKHPEDKATYQILSSIQERVDSVSSSRLFRTACSLDGRSSIVRNTETNLGNLLADAVRAYYETDIAFVNSGSIRCDRIISEGELTVRDVIDIVPFDNAFVVKRLTGRVLLRALENSVSDSRTDGRFLQLSGLSILVDLRRPEGARILRATLGSGQRVRSDDQTSYTVTMVGFIAEGFDGYVDFKEMETLVDVEGAMTDTSLMLQVLRRDSDEVDETDAMIDRARRTIIVGEKEGLPLVNPKVEGRIQFSGVL
ncbi:Metallo-dependent phosphatase [Hygrophoropsis aurantiaca]|uniref:Metallo-dependent phosphatase n=1 Tax=Hygrophoropsis aurantiaca TaxID=72124 RepID=A0ACB8A0R0_9AGAM|nr:Metallo-dependent phosphatase [Hygrophoropsis aurantiaca]